MKECCSLRLVCYIIAALHTLINALASIILIGCMVKYFHSEMDEIKENDTDKKVPFRRLVIVFLASFATFIFAIILIRGIQLNRKNLILPFLICMAIIIAVNIGHEIISFIVSLAKKETFINVIVTFIVGCIALGLEIASVVPVYLFYKNLEAKQLAAPTKPTDGYQQDQRLETLPGGQI